MQPSNDSALKCIASLTPAERETLLRETAERTGLSVESVKAGLLTDWRFVGRPKQQPPEGDWTYWFLLGGRIAGKTRAGAEWVKRRALAAPNQRVALVAPTFGDGRDTMVEGVSGLLSILAPDDLQGGSRGSGWNRSIGELYLANKTRLKVFSSEKPDRLRGPRHHFAWADELSSWQDANQGDKLETTWSNLKLSLGLGDLPQIAITSTPKPNKLTRELVALEASGRLVLGTESSYANRDNVPEAYWREVVEPYEGTRLGQQEIHALILEDVEGALWRTAQLEALRVDTHPDLHRVVVAVDPNVSSGEAANEAGIVVAGATAFGAAGYVLADRTTRGGPRAWAQAAVDAYHEFRADRIVAEANNGGEMVELTLKTVDPRVPVKLVHASRGKRTRAEPIASLYEGEAPKVRHVGYFPELESQMTSWTPDAESPDRMDACLVAGTLVTTAGGQVPIERVRAGDMVWTRAGWRQVRHAGMTCSDAETFTVEIGDGRALTGTAEHPVWVLGRGWTPLGLLRRPRPADRQPVYNLEVEGQPEFFANGLLVHNCVWALSELMLNPSGPGRVSRPRGRIPNVADRRGGSLGL
jgi:phage terminase large subunit-like protein